MEDEDVATGYRRRRVHMETTSKSNQAAITLESNSNQGTFLFLAYTYAHVYSHFCNCFALVIFCILF